MGHQARRAKCRVQRQAVPRSRWEEERGVSSCLGTASGTVGDSECSCRDGLVSQTGYRVGGWALNHPGSLAFEFWTKAVVFVYLFILLLLISGLESPVALLNTKC